MWSRSARSADTTKTKHQANDEQLQTQILSLDHSKHVGKSFFSVCIYVTEKIPYKSLQA